MFMIKFGGNYRTCPSGSLLKQRSFAPVGSCLRLGLRSFGLWVFRVKPADGAGSGFRHWGLFDKVLRVWGFGTLLRSYGFWA